MAINDSLSSLSKEEPTAILGYHVSPPRRAPGGSYPIVTLQLLIDAKKMNHRTRTGVLTKSDQRTQSLVTNDVLTIENARILSFAWCTEAGSVFSIDAVIMNVAPPSVLVRTINRLIRILLYDDIRFFLYSTVGGTLLGFVISRVFNRIIKRKKRPV